MCYISINFSTVKGASVAHVANKLSEKQKSNPDGSSVVVFKNGKKVIDDKNIVGYDNGELNNMLGAGSLSLAHLRMSTGGEVTDKNLHWWSLSGWRFAHNGSLYNPKYLKNKSGECDSLVLFKKMVELGYVSEGKDLEAGDIENIDLLADEANAWGRFALYNEKLDVMYLFGEWFVQLAKGLLSITSHDVGIYSERKSIAHFGAVDFSESVNVAGVLKSKLQGVHRIAKASAGTGLHFEFIDDTIFDDVGGYSSGYKSYVSKPITRAETKGYYSGINYEDYE